MSRENDLKEFFDKLSNINLTENDEIPEISSDDKVALVKLINDAKAEAQRLRILDIMNKVCK